MVNTATPGAAAVAKSTDQFVVDETVRIYLFSISLPVFTCEGKGHYSAIYENSPHRFRESPRDEETQNQELQK